MVLKRKYSRAFQYAISMIFLFVIQSCTSDNSLDLQNNRPPNILFAIADDASWKHFGAYGCDWVKTPGFDRVAREGLLFLNAYTPNAKSAPSRACILTGRNSWQLEEAANHAPFFPAKFKTYPEVLQENGYFVGSIAKGWAPGIAKDSQGQSRQLTGPTFNQYTATPPAQNISNEDYARNFKYFLEQRKDDQPFCFWYGGREPHRAYEFGAGSKYGGKRLQDVTEVPQFWPDVDSVRQDMLDYAFEIEHFDAHLVKMIETLGELGELENTIIIVTADNGMPFPRIKGDLYEYSHHLPLAIMWGKGIKNPGRSIKDYVNFIDFAPTFLELAQIEASKVGMQPTTGKSLTDLLYHDQTSYEGRDYVLIGKERHDVGRPNDEGYPIRGILRNDLLYLKNFKTDRWPKGNPETGYLNTDGSPTKSYLLNTRRVKKDNHYWTLNFGKRPTEELYNVVEDPFCMNNLAADPKFAEVKTKMWNELSQKLSDQKDPRIMGQGDIFDNYTYSGIVADYYNRYMGGEKVKANWVNPSDFEKDFPKKP